MSARSERAGLQEQVGRAVNSAGLRINGRAPGAETPLQQVAALGAAALHVHHGADRKNLPVAGVLARDGHRPDDQDAIAAELGSMLWHIKFGGQTEFVPRAAILFSAWLGYRGRFNFIDASERPALLHRMAVRALHEWLSDRCIACGGSKKLERSPTGAWIKPRGSMQRNAVFRSCPACAGTGRQAVSHTMRAQAIGISRERYDDERWDTHCSASIAWMNTRLMPRIGRGLHVQLERGKKRA